MATIAGGGGSGPSSLPTSKTSLGQTERVHCTQFMLDFTPIHAKKDPAEYSLIEYMKREPGYDLSFGKACIECINLPPVDTASELLETLVKIHEMAMSHITSKMTEVEKKKFDGHENSSHMYYVGVGPTSDFEGITDLVKQILFEKKQTYISFYQENQGNEPDFFYGVKNGNFFKCPKGSDYGTILFPSSKEPSPEERIKKILELIRPVYEVGVVGPEKKFPVKILSLYKTHVARSEKALMLIQNYLDSIKKAQNNEDKINTICVLCRELEQLHIFADGNGRAVFIFANLLLSINGLPPFYPTNTCIFDANSMARMVAEVTEGQKRFSNMFGTKEEFNKELELYVQTTEKLSELLTKNFQRIKPLKASFNERHFNLLVRQSAISDATMYLLEFLVKNRAILNIDLSYAGSTFGTALDIAKKHGNVKAWRLLKKAL